MIRMNQFASFTNEHFIIGTKNEPYKQPYCKLTVYGSFKSSKAIFVDDAFYENEQKMNSLQNNLVNGRIFSQGLIVGGLNDVRSTVNEGGILCSTLHTKGNIIMNNSTSLFIGGTELDEYTLDNIINNSVGWSGDTADFGNNIYNSDGDTIEINQDTQITGDFDVSATNITLNGDTNITGSYISIEGDTDITGSLTISSYLKIGSEILTESRLGELINANGGGGSGGGGSWTGNTNSLNYDTIYNSTNIPVAVSGNMTISGTLLVAETGKDIISIRDGKLFIGSKELTEQKIQLLDNVLSYEVSSSTPSIERSSTDNMFDGDSDVKGRMYSNELDAGDGKFTVDNDGQAFAMGMVIASDKRLKCDIQSLDTEIDILSQLRGVSYKLNKTFSGDKQFSKKTKYGVIAQEIQEHMPHIVNEDNKFLSVDYIQLVAFMPQLYRKIKKLEKEKQQQEQTIESLTKEFTDMRHKMKQMEEMIQTLLIKRV